MTLDIPILIFHEDVKGEQTAKNFIIKALPEIILTPIFDNKEIYQVFLPDGFSVDDLDNLIISLTFQLRKQEKEIDDNTPFTDFNQICKNHFLQLIVFNEDSLPKDNYGNPIMSLQENVLRELEFFKKAPLIPHPSEIPNPIEEIKTFLSFSLSSWYDYKQVFSIENKSFPNKYKDNLSNIAENAVNFAVNLLEDNSFTAMSALFHDNQFPMNYHFHSTLLFDEDNYQKLHDITFNKKVFTDLIVIFLERTYQLSPFFFVQVNHDAKANAIPSTVSSITPYRKVTKNNQEIFWIHSQEPLLDLTEKKKYDLLFFNHIAEMVVNTVKTYYGVINYEKVRSYIMDSSITKGDFVHCFPLVMKDMKHINQIVMSAQHLIE